MRKQLYYIVLVLLVSVHLSSCKEDPIPTVSLEMLPTELVGLGETMLFDTLPYTITEYISDTITPDSIVVDTLVIDPFSIDTFWMDTICLFGAISYAGDALTGPALNEVGFCVDDYVYYIVYESLEPETPAFVYDTFAYILPVRYDEKMYVHSYAINPFGTVRSKTIHVRMSDFDER